MKNTISYLSFILFFSFGCTQQRTKFIFQDGWLHGLRFSNSGIPEQIKKEKLKEVTLVDEIIPSYPKTGYKNTINYVSVDIKARCDHKSITASGHNDTLTSDQKSIFSKVDLGTYIYIDLKYTYKDTKNTESERNRKVKEMHYMVEATN
jgi:hypothetical protein